MNSEQLHKDAASLAEIVVRILFMKHDKIQDVMTHFGYMVIKFIKAVARTQKNDTDKEFSKFLGYLADIYENERIEESNNASIINLN